MATEYEKVPNVPLVVFLEVYPVVYEGEGNVKYYVLYSHESVCAWVLVLVCMCWCLCVCVCVCVCVRVYVCVCVFSICE